MFQQLLAQNPGDAFTRYGLAMEFVRLGQIEPALQEFETLLSQNPDYEAGYFMAAQTLAKQGRTEEAIEHLRSGIAAAERKGNGHAQSEMEAMLDELGG
ncbi:MAG: tetratricopeptide repeat protein [Acidobacteriales bacterium]|nr:tetratricopeptide repeat protein [Terriglobales bacterium]